MFYGTGTAPVQRVPSNRGYGHGRQPYPAPARLDGVRKTQGSAGYSEWKFKRKKKKIWRADAEYATMIRDLHVLNLSWPAKGAQISRPRLQTSSIERRNYDSIDDEPVTILDDPCAQNFVSGTENPL
ncbi:hypothetical protein B0H13DRAFT_1886500 [Mycena leptocephala]|nr:hypothetical protein B0H13DRAFT_1886500 [Mycena leptocephala]